MSVHTDWGYVSWRTYDFVRHYKQVKLFRDDSYLLKLMTSEDLPTGL